MQKTAICNRTAYAIPRAGKHRLLAKTLLVMKLTLILLMFGLFSAQARGVSQTITLSAKEMSLNKVFTAIEKQTGYVVFSNKKLFAHTKPVSFSVVDLPLTAFLQMIVEGQPIIYEISSKTILIKEKPVAVKEQIQVDYAILPPVKGVVRDAEGNPLSGASIKIKGKDKGVFTDENGNFTINADNRDILVITYVGMANYEMRVSALPADGNILMKPKDASLDDVVVTGYTNIKKESFTGNAVTVKREQLLKTNPNSLIGALQVFDPSFRIKENNMWGSDPNALPEFTLRGESSIGMDKSLEAERLRRTQRTNLKDNPNLPIFILDGFEVSVQTIVDMDMNRVETVNILKDAAATALHGSRASNGVLIITTIAPRPGEMRITYNLTNGIELPDLSDYNLTNAEEKLRAEILSGVYNLDAVNDLIKINDLTNRIAKGVNSDWMAQPLRNVFNQKHTLYLEGGAETVRYAINLNHDTNNGAMKNSRRGRSGGGLTLDYRGNGYQLKNQTTYNTTRMEESNYGNFVTYATQQPYEEIFDADGNYLPTISGVFPQPSPLWKTTMDSYIGKGFINELQNNTNVIWNILPNLRFDGQFSVTKTDTEVETYDDPKGYSQNTASDQRGKLDQTFGKGYTWNLNALLHYNKDFNGHFVSLTTGVNSRETYSENYLANYTGFQLGSLHGPSFAARQVSKTKYESDKTRLMGALISANYTYNNIYLADISARVDGSSQFGNDERFAKFWALGVGMNMHNQEWMQAYPAISKLKPRATYGVTGKVSFPAYAAVTTYGINEESWYYTGSAGSIDYLGNPQLKWENTYTLDAGVELGLFNNIINLIATYYNRKTDGIIDQVSISPASGYATYQANSGTIVNKGIELDLNAIVYHTKNINVAIRANLGSNQNRIKELGDASKAYNKIINDQYEANFGTKELQTTPITRYYVGASTTAIYAVRSAGIDPANGKERFIRYDGSSTYTWNALDQAVVGDETPKIRGALGLNVAYKGLFLNTSFLYQSGAQMYNTTLLNKVENADIKNSNVDRRVLSQRWKQPGDIAPFLAISDNRITRPTDRFVQKNNYLHFNSLSVGYDFPLSMIEKLRLTTLGLRFNANDVARWSTIFAERGISYPFAKNYEVTLNVSFK